MDRHGSKRTKTILSFFKSSEETSISDKPSTPVVEVSTHEEVGPSQSPSQGVEINYNSLERDPGLRTPIREYFVNVRDDIRRAYIKMGPYQPRLAEYPRSQFGIQYRRFQSKWFKTFPWMEYSPEKDAVFCFPCYLFEKDAVLPFRKGCSVLFCFPCTLTKEGFRCWNRVNDGANCPFLTHIGSINSPHRKSVKSVEDLSNVTRHIDKVINVQTSEDVRKNRLRLMVTTEAIRWLSLQGCAFRGHREDSTSKNRGNLIEMVKLLGRLNVNIEDVILDNAPRNATYTSPKIQKEILQIMANMVRNKIREEIGDGKFCLLVDEAKDSSSKEEMAIVLRFVDGQGSVKERFFDIVEVENTVASTLKKSICNSLARYNLPIDDLRGQGYDGASNMRGELNGLQALFRRDCPYAYFVHCFAHRLQLALVAASKKEPSIWVFFLKMTSIVNLIGSSPKRLAELQAFQAMDIARMVASGERETGKGANQIGNLQRAGETRWNSHFDSICSVIDMYWATMQVLEK